MKNLFEEILVKDIIRPCTTPYEKGLKYHVEKRKMCGLSLSITGKRTYTMNDKNFVCDSSTAVLIPQGCTYHGYDNTDGSYYFVDFICDNLGCDEIVAFPLQNPTNCHRRFEALLNTDLNRKNRLKMYAAFYELLNSVSATPLRHRSLDLIVKYIEQHISDPELSNTLLAEQGNISEVYMRKLFLEYFNTTPKQYILDTRIRVAQQRLTQTADSLATIAEECGFSSSYHLSRAFKARTGLTPSEFAGNRHVRPI